MHAYCNNNPIMYTDSLGTAPEWWQWAISGAMVVGGVGLVATGVGGFAGGALLCAGVNSIIGSYVSEASGGSSLAGWCGGMITGAISGAGAGIAGNMLNSATQMSGAACLKTVFSSGVVAYASGSAGAVLGTNVTARMDGYKPTKKETKKTATIGGITNFAAGILSGMGTAISSMPLCSTTTKVVANALTTGWSIISEAVADIFSTVAGLLRW